MRASDFRTLPGNLDLLGLTCDGSAESFRTLAGDKSRNRISESPEAPALIGSRGAAAVLPRSGCPALLHLDLGASDRLLAVQLRRLFQESPHFRSPYIRCASQLYMPQILSRSLQQLPRIAEHRTSHKSKNHMFLRHHVKAERPV